MCPPVYRQALVLAPTREIATQVTDVARTIGRYLAKLRCCTCIGGIDVSEDRAALADPDEEGGGAQLVVGTPPFNS